MSKKSMVLGYTRSGHSVMLPTTRKPDMALFENWTPGDHLDAARILVEHGERASEPIGPWCKRWAKDHKTVGKDTKRSSRHGPVQIRGGVETTILSRRGR